MCRDRAVWREGNHGINEQFDASALGEQAFYGEFETRDRQEVWGFGNGDQTMSQSGYQDRGRGR